jgi:di/tricarboxylate transporter
MTFDLASISLAALVVVIVLSCVTTLHPGILSLIFACVIGVYLAPFWGRAFTIGEVMGGFPAELFLTLVGVTLLFSLAQGSGALAYFVRGALALCRGNVGLIPIVFFGLSLLVSSLGAGNIAAAALIAPVAMSIAEKAGISPFLMTLMVGHGCVAGALSPIAPTGIIANGLLARMAMPGLERATYLNNLFANALAAGAGYLVFGGPRLLGRRIDEFELGAQAGGARGELTTKQKFTIAVMAALIVAVVGFQVHLGLGALIAACLLKIARVADDRLALQSLPWSVILMVCGVTVLTSLLEKTGGIDLFTTIVTRFATHRTITGLMAFVTGLVSVYSSTSGVVLPAFLPSVTGLVEKLGGGDPQAIASSILIGGHLVDVSPLSTIGALCVASAPVSADRRALFNQVLAWGLSMSVIGAIGCYLAFGNW